MAQETAKQAGRVSFKNEFPASARVPEALTVVATIPVADIDQLGIGFSVADQNLDQFAFLGKFHKDLDFVTLDAAITATPAGLVVGASGTLATTAAAATAWLILDTRPLYEVQIKAASANVAGSTLTIAGHGKGSV